MIELKGRKATVVGMARSGMAAVELLVSKGALVTAVDQRDASALGDAGMRLMQLGVPLRSQTPESLLGAELIVLSPGVPVDAPEIEDARGGGAQVIGEVELASYYLQGPVIGVTGSNGKTTTTSLLGHILRESGVAGQVGGNIGTPPTSMIETSDAGQWNVLELSSFQLETIRHFRARVGVCLNVTPDHLDRHHTFENYASAKARLFETQQQGDCAILNADDATCVSYATRSRARILWFSMLKRPAAGAWLDGNSSRIMLNDEPLLPATEIPLSGRHNVENTMAAALAAQVAGAELAQIAAAIRTFPGVEHRLEFVRERNGVKFYNDSKATNVDAAEKAIDSFSGRLWIILGGKDKNSDYRVLRDKLKEKARCILLIGDAAGKIANQLGDGIPLVQAGTLEAAVAHAGLEAAAGDIVLLAPACASFDQFENYEHRGRVFKQAVGRL